MRSIVLKMMTGGLLVAVAAVPAYAQSVRDDGAIDGMTSSPGFYGATSGSGRDSGTGDDLGNHVATQDLMMGGNYIIGVPMPVEPGDVASKAYVDAVSGGGSGAGDNLGNHSANANLRMNGYHIVGVPMPQQSSAAASKAYVDSVAGGGSLRVDTGVGLTGGGRLDSGIELRFDTSYGDARYVRSGRSIVGTSGIVGGGDLSQNRTLTLDGTVVRTDGAQAVSGRKTFSDVLDKAGTKIVNLGSPSDPDDAVNLRTLETRSANMMNYIRALETRIESLEANSP